MEVQTLQSMRDRVGSKRERDRESDRSTMRRGSTDRAIGRDMDRDTGIRIERNGDQLEKRSREKDKDEL